MRDHQPVIIEEYNGYWNRGGLDTVPTDHFSECINIIFNEGGFQTRDGLAVALARSSSVLRYYYYPDAGAGDGFLILGADTKIYHAYGAIPSTWTVFQVSNAIATMTDFGFVSINGRAYISPSLNTNLSGLTGEFVYVYDGGGVNMMRKAAGTKPTTAEGNMAVANGAAGKIEAGIHVFGVVYETSSGFLTSIGPDTLPTLTATGALKANLTAIPIFAGGGGTLITKRHIVASKLIPVATYSGDAKNYQLFFVPAGEIANNTATTLTVDFYDSELTEDASHLLDLLAEIPAVGGLSTYHGRMLGWDTATNINEVLVSYPDEPEAFDTVDGILLVPKEGVGISICQEYRDILYVFKPTKTYAFSDNSDAPTTWSSAVIDQGLGAGKHGISSVGAYGGIDIEALVLVNESGVYAFTGVFAKPELTYKIRDYWLTLSRGSIRTGQISACTDPITQTFYINDPNTFTVIVGNFSKGLDAAKIKWSKWTFAGLPAPNTIGLFGNLNTLFFGMPTGVHFINIGGTNDVVSPSAAAAIPDPTVISALINDGVPETSDESIYHFAGIRLRVIGTGVLRYKLYGLDGVTTLVLATQTLSTTPGKEIMILSNFMAQRARYELKTTGINENFNVNRTILYTKPVFTGFPA